MSPSGPKERVIPLKPGCQGFFLQDNPVCYLQAFCFQIMDKILVANRGEIACRILRISKKLGIKTVAIFSDIDRNCMHVELADEAYNIGPAPSSQSYLRQNAIIDIAKSTKCQAIHPGYGFLSENFEFANSCATNGVIFIGPPADSIRNMGSKSASKMIMAQAGIPTVKGYHGYAQDNETLIEEAEKIGFPLMIKAVRGGGGKGMRIVRENSEFPRLLESARTESKNSFGDSSVLLEQYISKPRHIEVQIFADHRGNIVCLSERDCSIQRRHQKVIEEAPAPGVSERLRHELKRAAIQVTTAVRYTGAGTVEFLVDKSNQEFYFMEMNTRLQVEHPVTEMITGVDLIEWQLRIAAGEDLPLKQDEISIDGHAVEARIYAEDPRRGFSPVSGTIHHLRQPISSQHVRVDTGVRQNDEISIYYDSMLAKLIVWGRNRDESLRVMRSKLDDYQVVGIETNIDFIRSICDHPKFKDGHIHTGFIEENADSLDVTVQIPNRVMIDGALAIILSGTQILVSSPTSSEDLWNPFISETGSRLNHHLIIRSHFVISEQEISVAVQCIAQKMYLMQIDTDSSWRTVYASLIEEDGQVQLKSEFNGVIRASPIFAMANELYLFSQSRRWKLEASHPQYLKGSSDSLYSIFGATTSPIHGIVDVIFVGEGYHVRVGDPLLMIVAMKMEHTLRSPRDGIIQNILCQPGSSVAKGEELIYFEDN